MVQSPNHRRMILRHQHMERLPEEDIRQLPNKAYHHYRRHHHLLLPKEVPIKEVPMEVYLIEHHEDGVDGVDGEWKL